MLLQDQHVSMDLTVTAALTFTHDFRQVITILHGRCLIHPWISAISPSHKLVPVPSGFSRKFVWVSIWIYVSVSEPVVGFMYTPYTRGFSSSLKLEEAQSMVEPPLFKTFNGIEFPAHLKPSQMLAGTSLLPVWLVANTLCRSEFTSCHSILYLNEGMLFCLVLFPSEVEAYVNCFCCCSRVCTDLKT